MTKRKLMPLLFLVFNAICNNLAAQNTRFPTAGTITFERNINTYGIIQKMVDKQKDNPFMGTVFDSYKKTEKQFKILQSTLYFSDQKTLFKPTEDLSVQNQFFSNSAELKQINTVYSDCNSGQQIIQKKVFEETFLVKDSIRHIDWKMTSETRDIAGYTCRRANAIVMDSIYVVAFYTEQIPVSSGPEGFAGLPGMILGIALPHDNVTWFAKTVTDQVIDPKVLIPPAKGKVIDKKGLVKTLTDVLSDWSSDVKSLMRPYML
jgi:GLPGLI family protein